MATFICEFVPLMGMGFPFLFSRTTVTSSSPSSATISEKLKMM